MSELLIRAQDNVDLDPFVNLKSWKRGMVVVVMPDGWAWGKEELNNPLFTIFQVPDMSVTQASVFLGSLIPVSGKDTTNPLRQFKVNLDDPSVIASVPTAGGLVRPNQAVSLTQAQVLAIKSTVSVAIV